MPHSSGGGSSSGGTHSGSSSSGSSSINTRRYSSTPFPGAICYAYYDRHYHPHLMYVSKGLDITPSSFIGPLICALVALFFTIFIFVFPSYHNPHKLKTDYYSEIVINDDNSVLKDDELLSLKETFTNFFDTTGISPSFLSIDFNTINGYSDLEEYAYDYYVNNFKDERHWLIVYSSKEGTIKEDWAFEGMQGNETDPILHTRITDKFNKAFYNALKQEDTSVASSLNLAFDEIAPLLMKKTFFVEPVSIIASLVALGFTIYLTFSGVAATRTYQKMKNAVIVPNEPILKTCPKCGCLYYSESMDTCYRCGEELEK